MQHQVFGRGAREIVFVPDHPNNIEIMWEDPALSRFLERLATMGRVICFDKRGTGISDPVPLGAIPTIERWMDDITTVIDEVGEAPRQREENGDQPRAIRPMQVLCKPF